MTSPPLYASFSAVLPSGRHQGGNKGMAKRAGSRSSASKKLEERLQKIESRPEKTASPSAGTLMPGIMYLQMRNGLANGFPSTSVIDPTAGMRFKF
jgi:hypothetical protein